MKRMLIGLALMFFGYATGLFEWHLLVIVSNILGICVFYSGYLSSPLFRELHLSTSVSVYGLSNLILLALHLNGLKVHEFVLDNPLTLLLAGISIILPLLVLYYPNRFFVQIAGIWAEEHHLENVRMYIKRVHQIGMFSVGMTALFYLFFPSFLTVTIFSYFFFHCIVLGLFGFRYHTQATLSPIKKEAE